MVLPKLKTRGLFVLKTLYTITSLFVFLPITFYWALGLIITPASILSFKSGDGGYGWLIFVIFITLSGFALLCFSILNLKVFAEKLHISQIPKVVNIGVGIGCLFCAPLIITFGLGLIPIIIVACLYYIAYHNSLKTKAEVSTPTSQSLQPQE